jgi:hypothetical protein
MRRRLDTCCWRSVCTGPCHPEEDFMTPLSQLSSHPALYLQDLRTLIEDIVYARALIATIGGDI